MKKIVLLCASGMSTSMLVKKMQEAAKAENYDCELPIQQQKQWKKLQMLM